VVVVVEEVVADMEEGLLDMEIVGAEVDIHQSLDILLEWGVTMDQTMEVEL